LHLEIRHSLFVILRFEYFGRAVGNMQYRFGTLSAGFEFTNLLDSRYQEVVGVDMPGRWLMFSIRTR